MNTKLFYFGFSLIAIFIFFLLKSNKFAKNIFITSGILGLLFILNIWTFEKAEIMLNYNDWTQCCMGDVIKENPQNEIEVSTKTQWLIEKLTENFKKHNYSISEHNFLELKYGEVKALGFEDSKITIIIFDKNHEILGNDEEFKDEINGLESKEFYGEVMLETKQINPDILLKYTKTPIMANHGAMQNVYFYNLPDGNILKVKVRFPADPEIYEESEKKIIKDMTNEIHNILLFTENPISISDQFTSKENQVTINSENLTFTFPDEFYIYDDEISFGPQTHIPESPTDKIYTRPAFTLKVIPQRNLEEIKNTVTTTNKVTSKTINNFTIATWDNSGFCENFLYEIIGKKNNIQLDSTVCEEINAEEYFDNLVNNVILD